MFPEPDEDGNGLPAVQYAALMADLVMKTKQTLASLFPEQGGQFTHLRLRTKQDTELIITDISRENNEYILCAIQNCKFEKEIEEDEAEEVKDWNLKKETMFGRLSEDKTLAKECWR